ncbi:MAG: mannose-1-phosphate guanylyltransferase [Proteobacteria bacterium]|nr:mannose-1-phosphate guanylyltransferase [Pseudomonadota bacterium]
MNKLFSGSLSKNLKAVAVIMAGGSGTRFWPLSRKKMPKQFLNLAGTNRSLIQMTADRLEILVGGKGIGVVTAASQSPMVQEQLPEVSIISEPCQRNTAACIGYAAIMSQSLVGDLPMIFVPADHMVWEEEELLALYRDAIELAAKEEVLVTIGIAPTFPETGYGYIKKGGKVSWSGKYDLFKVDSFVEKPNLETAKHYLESGEYFWNSGMFVWRPSVLLAEIQRQMPALHQGLMQIKEIFENSQISEDDKFEKVRVVYNSLESISIDYGVMEKAKNVRLFIGDKFRWSDVGSWSSWMDVELQTGEKKDNYINADAVFIDSVDCAVLSNKYITSKKFIAGVGVKDLIIVETEDAILICHRDRAQDVKKVVDHLKNEGREELL